MRGGSGGADVQCACPVGAADPSLQSPSGGRGPLAAVRISETRLVSLWH